MAQTAALAGISVLDYGSVGPGARASRILADYGAEVVRLLAPPGAGRHELPFYAYGAQRGFRRCAVDLKNEEGRRAALDLAAGCDVVIEGFRPGVADRLGIGYEAVRSRNPSVVYCAASSYGQSGPYASWAGHDINYLAVTGFLACGQPAADGGPALPGATVADAAGGGMHAALAVLAALVARAAGSGGRFLDVAATDGMLGIMAINLDELLATGAVPEPGHDVLTGRFACYGTYECADRRWIAVGAIEGRFFGNLCRHLGIADGPARQYDPAAQAELRSEIAAALRQRPRDDWVAELGPADTCVAPVYAIEEVVADRHHRHRGAFVAAEHETMGGIGQTGPLWAGCLPPDGPLQLQDQYHTEPEAVLARVGYSPERVAALKRQGVIG